MAYELKRIRFLETSLFLMRIKLRAIFLGAGSAWLNVVRFFILIFVVAYGLYYGFLFDAMVSTDRINVSVTQADVLLQSIVISIVIFVNYFPGFRPSGNFIAEPYPVRRGFRIIINYVHDLMNLIYMYTMVFLAAVWYNSDYFGIWNLIVTLILFLTTINVERTAKIFIENEVKKFRRLMFFWTTSPLMIIGYFAAGYWVEPDLGTRLSFSVLLFAYTGFMYRYIDLFRIQVKTRHAVVVKDNVWTRLLDIPQRVYFRRKSVRPLIFILPMLKLMALLYGVYLFQGTRFDDEGFSTYYVLALMLPIMPFTYVHNNYAGFFREKWLKVELLNGGMDTHLLMWVRTLVPILIADTIISFGILIYADLLTPDYVILFALTILVLIPVGIIGSIMRARHIEHFLSIQNITSFKNNSSTFITFVDFGLIAILFYLYQNGLLQVATPIILSIVLISLYLMRNIYPWGKHQLYQDLFK